MKTLSRKKLQDTYGVILEKTRECFDSHRVYWEIWSKDKRYYFGDAWTLKEAEDKLKKAGVLHSGHG